jgi:hypothetical protein
MNPSKDKILTKPIGIIAAIAVVAMLILRVWEIARDHEGNPFYLVGRLGDVWDDSYYDFAQKVLLLLSDASITLLIAFCLFALVTLFLNRGLLVLISSIFFTIVPLSYMVWYLNSFLKGDSTLENTVQSLPIISAFTQDLFFDGQLMIWKAQYNLGLIVFGLLLTAGLLMMMKEKSKPARMVEPNATPRLACPTCNSAVDADAKFCSTCGQPFVARVV